MELPDLKLIMVQGPRSGETLGFKPGSKIRIGRVVSGNDVTIKDKGISSKHLVIESGSGKWTIQDLDSSNGTFLNSDMLPLNTPVELHENDTIKLGDCTTILVKIIMDGQDESEAKPRRNPRRQANVPASASLRATRGCKKAEAEPVENLGLQDGEIQNQSKITKKGRKRMKYLQEMPPERSEVQIECKMKLEPEEVSEVQVDVKETLRPGDESSKNCVVECMNNLGLEGGEIGSECKIIKKVRGRRKNIQEMPPDSSGVQVDGKEMVNVTTTASVRVTRSQKNAANLELNCGETVNEIKITRNGRGRKRKLQEMPPQSGENLEPGEVSNNCEVQVDDKESLGPVEASAKNCEVQVGGTENLKLQEAANRGDVKESCDNVEDKVNSEVKKQVVDLEKMTLGEWFDYMEVYLRKQIMDSTEEMIEEMRRKAERVYKYMIEERKKKKMGRLGEGQLLEP